MAAEARPICPYGKGRLCHLLTNAEHVRSFVHHCRYGATCRKRVDANHEASFVHIAEAREEGSWPTVSVAAAKRSASRTTLVDPILVSYGLTPLPACKNGANCKKSKTKNHASSYSHPCIKGSACVVMTPVHRQRFSHECCVCASCGAVDRSVSATQPRCTTCLNRKLSYVRSWAALRENVLWLEGYVRTGETRQVNVQAGSMAVLNDHVVRATELIGAVEADRIVLDSTASISAVTLVAASATAAETNLRGVRILYFDEDGAEVMRSGLLSALGTAVSIQHAPSPDLRVRSVRVVRDPPREVGRHPMLEVHGARLMHSLHVLVPKLDLLSPAEQLFVTLFLAADRQHVDFAAVGRQLSELSRLPIADWESMDDVALSRIEALCAGLSGDSALRVYAETIEGAAIKFREQLAEKTAVRAEKAARAVQWVESSLFYSEHDHLTVAFADARGVFETCELPGALQLVHVIALYFAARYRAILDSPDPLAVMALPNSAIDVSYRVRLSGDEAVEACEVSLGEACRALTSQRTAGPNRRRRSLVLSCMALHLACVSFELRESK